MELFIAKCLANRGMGFIVNDGEPRLLTGEEDANANSIMISWITDFVINVYFIKNSMYRISLLCTRRNVNCDVLEFVDDNSDRHYSCFNSKYVERFAGLMMTHIKKDLILDYYCTDFLDEPLINNIDRLLLANLIKIVEFIYEHKDMDESLFDEHITSCMSPRIKGARN